MFGRFLSTQILKEKKETKPSMHWKSFGEKKKFSDMKSNLSSCLDRVWGPGTFGPLPAALRQSCSV